jgi:hypothetical protein
MVVGHIEPETPPVHEGRAEYREDSYSMTLVRDDATDVHAIALLDALHNCAERDGR